MGNEYFYNSCKYYWALFLDALKLSEARKIKLRGRELEGIVPNAYYIGPIFTFLPKKRKEKKDSIYETIFLKTLDMKEEKTETPIKGTQKEAEQKG